MLRRSTSTRGLCLSAEVLEPILHRHQRIIIHIFSYEHKKTIAWEFNRYTNVNLASFVRSLWSLRDGFSLRKCTVKTSAKLAHYF